MHKVTLIPGDGIGSEIAEAVQKIFAAAKAPITWETCLAGQAALAANETALPEATLASIRTNKLALKGPLTTQIGAGYRSLNVTLRQTFDLYCNLRPVKTLPGIATRYPEGVNIVIFRENTEDLYAGTEQKLGKSAAVALKTITADASLRIAKAAFAYAAAHGRKTVTAVHKANIMKCTDGLFLECVRAVAADYPDIAYQEVIIDNLCMQLVMNPQKYDVLVAPNLYGDIISDLCAALVGGLGVVPGANIGENCAIFEAVHGTAPDIAGKGLANPTAMLLSATMLLDHLGESDKAQEIRKALESVLQEGITKTADLGGKATTLEFTNAIISKLKG
ncbi:MAG: isocitrate/isopropylmalate dehydrogenase family protein [Sporomusaceae bacterium]|nr:isocitrate/isopropylmalate dehydrogenase family protein [Sporomusaceae bacterium]